MSDVSIHPANLTPVHTMPGPTAGAGLAQRCFGARPELPAWLAQPLRALQAANVRQRPVAARVADLVEMADGVDRLFAEHLAAHWEWFHEAEAGALPAHEAVPRWVEGLYAEGAQLLQRQVLPDLAAHGIDILPVVQTDETAQSWLHKYFVHQVYPRLTPLAVDPGRPFPFISSESLNLLVELRRPDGAEDRPAWARLFARVKIPVEMPALIAVPQTAGGETARAGKAPVYVWAADLVRFFVHHLFPGMPVRRVTLFRLIRGEAPLPGMLRRSPARHRRQEDRPVVRVDVEERMEAPVLEWLVEHLQIPGYAVARHSNLLEWHGLPSVLDVLGNARAASRPV